MGKGQKRNIPCARLVPTFLRMKRSVLGGATSGQDWGATGWALMDVWG